MNVQTCVTCRCDKPLTLEFWHSDTSRDNGYSVSCKFCRRDSDRRRMQKKWRQFQKRANHANFAAQRTRFAEIRDVDQLTTEDVLIAFSLAKGRCDYCHQKLYKNSWQLDHFQPLSRGGANSPENIRVCCPDCNQAKGNMLPIQWLSELAARGIWCADTPLDMPIAAALPALEDPYEYVLRLIRHAHKLIERANRHLKSA